MGILFTALCAIGVLVCFINPVYAACSFVIAIIFRANENVQGVMFPVIPAMIIITGLAYFIHMHKTVPRPEGTRLTSVPLLVAMLGLLALHQLIWHRDELIPWILGDVAPIVLMFLFAVRFMGTPSRLHAFYSAFGAGSVLIGAQAFLVHFLFKQPMSMFRDQYGYMVVSHGELWDSYHFYHDRDLPEKYGYRLMGRATGTWGNANDLAMICNWGISVAIYYFRRKGSKLLRLAGVGVAMMLVTTIILTGSRGNLVQLGIILWTIFVGGKRKALGIALLVIAVVGVLVVLPRLAPQRTDEDASRDERTQLLIDNIRMFVHSPIKGVGYNNSQEGAFKPLLPHNVYVQCLSETGLIGSAIFFSMIFFFRRDTSRAVKYFNAAGDHHLEALARCISGMHFAFLIFMLFTNQFMRFTYGIVMALGVALHLTAAQHRLTAGEEDGEGEGQAGEGKPAPRPGPAARRLAAREIVEEPVALPQRGRPALEPHREGARYVYDPDAPEESVQVVDKSDDLEEIDDALDGEWPPRRGGRRGR
jgi:O-antigen ligase